MTNKRTTWRTSRAGFTLIELLIVVGIISLLLSILLPCLSRAKTLTRKTVCAVNIRHLHQAFMLYLMENDGKYFPYQENLTDGTLWYWGFEPAGASSEEGSRPVDTGRARLAPYFQHAGAMQICPEARRISTHFKPKFNLAGYGYAINRCMLHDGAGNKRYDQITKPWETVAWADSMQINTWQEPASPSNPMLEEWYYLDNRINCPATFHFRHGGLCNSAFADGSVRELSPFWLDSRCDGQVGRPEQAVPPSKVSYLLQLDK
ncbi:MAG: prepilin-type N-terminal cleavage/methylation domain-containing protein [Planctomycetota bacterium]|nr:prepilin-type N-terminal cleavage/methylation domain-containing protein [Planctomycetota bacterium]